MKEKTKLPYVRFARFQNGTFSNEFFRAYDHRLFYCTNGEGIIEIEGKKYRLRRGTLLIWRSGLKYRYTEMKDINTTALNFDASSDFKNLTTPISPALYECFEEQELLEKDSLPLGLPDIVLLDKAQELEGDIERIREEFSCKRLGFEDICSALLLCVLNTCARILLNETEEKSTKKGEQILLYIRKNLQTPLTYESIGEVFHYHPMHINRLVKKHTGMSFHSYVKHCRTELAIHMLETTDLPISTIAARLCFADIKSFSRCFKLSTGHTPSYYRGII